MRGRAVLAAACALASPEACAHGGAVPPWVPVLLVIALGGMVACVLVPLLVETGSLWMRFFAGVGWAVLDFLAWDALLWITFSMGRNVPMPAAGGYAAFTVLTLSPYILPVVLYVRARRRATR